MINRKQPDELADKRPILDAAGRFRRVLLQQSDKVTPFGATYRAIHLVAAAVDALAEFLTGDRTLYHAGGSTPGSDASKWRDSGR